MRRISVLVPTYNAGSHLSQALESIKPDLYQGDEVIIQDSMSADSTSTIVERFAAEVESDVRYYREIDEGQSEALDRALHRARNEHTVWLNADDCLVGLDILRQNADVDIVCGGFTIENLDSHVLRSFRGRPLNLRALLIEGCYQFSGAVLMSTELLRAVGGFNNEWRYCMDYDLFLRIAKANPSTRALPDVVARFRRHRRSKSGSARMGFVRETHRLRREYGQRILPSPLLYAATARHFVAAASSDLRYTPQYSRLRCAFSKGGFP